MNPSQASHHDVPTTVEQLLAAASTRLTRLSADQAHAAMRDGAQLIDIRSDHERTTDGVIPGGPSRRATCSSGVDPACPHHDPDLCRPDASLVLICNEGYQSSLAVATVQSFGGHTVTDVIGGFKAWPAAGLPIHRTQREAS